MQKAPLALGLGLLALACPDDKKPREDPNVVAVVNGELIARVEFERELDREMQALEPASRTPEQVEPFKRTLLETLIERALLLQAARAADVTVTPEEVDRRVLRLSADYPAETFDQALAQGHTSPTEFQRRTANVLLIEKLLQEQVYARVAATEDEIRRYFAEHPHEFEQPEQVRVAQIVVKELDDARKLLQQARSGKKFSELATRYSIAPEAKVGGDLGFFAKGTMPKPLEEAAFSLGVGSTSEVITTEYGHHLIRVLERRPAKKNELSDVRAKVEEKVLAKKREQAQHDFVRDLRGQAKLTINEQTLAAVTRRIHE